MRKVLRRSHFAFERYVPERPYKVYGASPAIVFIPPGPIASIRRTISSGASVHDGMICTDPQASTRRAARKPNRGWQKLQAMMNGDCDTISGYDAGECEMQRRGIH